MKVEFRGIIINGDPDTNKSIWTYCKDVYIYTKDNYSFTNVFMVISFNYNK